MASYLLNHDDREAIDSLIAIKSNSATNCCHDLLANGDNDDSSVEMVQMMIERVPRQMWSASDSGGFTPLHHAALAGNNTAIKALVAKYGEEELSLNCQTHEGLTPLHLAYKEKQATTVELLLSLPSVNTALVDKYGRLPITLK